MDPPRGVLRETLVEVLSSLKPNTKHHPQERRPTSERPQDSGVSLTNNLQFVPVDLQQVLSIRQQPDVTTPLAATLHLVLVRGDLLIRGAQIAQRLLEYVCRYRCSQSSSSSCGAEPYYHGGRACFASKSG